MFQRISLRYRLLIIPATLIIDYVWFQEIPISERVSISEVEQQAPDLETAIRQLEAKLRLKARVRPPRQRTQVELRFEWKHLSLGVAPLDVRPRLYDRRWK